MPVSVVFGVRACDWAFRGSIDFPEFVAFGEEVMSIVVDLDEVLAQQGFQKRPGPPGILLVLIAVDAFPDFFHGVKHPGGLLQQLIDLLFHGMGRRACSSLSTGIMKRRGRFALTPLIPETRHAGMPGQWGSEGDWCQMPCFSMIHSGIGSARRVARLTMVLWK
jgi:hypothetical protein